MNITEEQNMNGETNRPIKYNSEAPNVVPSAKKVYSKPTLVILSSTAAQGAKIPIPLRAAGGRYIRRKLTSRQAKTLHIQEEKIIITP